MALRTTAVMAVLLVVGLAGSARGYAVGPAIPLEQLATTADLVCKATVIADAPVVDPWFRPVPGYEPREATLRVVSVIKGKATAKTIQFRRYARAKSDVGFSYTPQFYELEVGRTYLVFAAREAGEVYRQLSSSHTQKPDQGVMVTASARRPRGNTITEVVWHELRALLASKRDADVLEAIRQLDELSGGRRLELSDLDRKAALAAILPKVSDRIDAIASAAITVFGADSRYLDDQQAPYWLAGLGTGAIEGMGPLTATVPPASAVAVRALSAVATSTRAPALRAQAIRALGGAPIAAKLVATWSTDPDLAVRSAAVLVSADAADRTVIVRAVTDGSPEVRHAAALAIGFTQDATLLPKLGSLLGDLALSTRGAAALALLSFPVDQAASLMRTHLGSDFRPLFVNALARRDPAPYLRDLADVITRDLKPDRFWGGSLPAGVSWKILFAYVAGRPATELTAGTLDRSLDALERMRWFSSSEPRDLYALYLVRGLKARAARFRVAMRKAVSYDIDYFFDMADKSPSTYVP